MKVIFDMDGTIVDFYNEKGWLTDLHNENPKPYENAKPLVNMSRLARAIHKAQAYGIIVAVVSWGAMDSTENFLKATEKAKREWLARHLPSVHFDEINIIPYGISKSNYADTESILFDDNTEIRNEFIGKAYEPNAIFEILKGVKK